MQSLYDSDVFSHLHIHTQTLDVLEKEMFPCVYFAYLLWQDKDQQRVKLYIKFIENSVCVNPISKGWMNSQLNPNTLLAERCVAHIVFVAKIVYPRGARSGVNKFHTLNELQIQYPLTLIEYRLSSTFQYNREILNQY